ncbi:MAG: DnaA/Hda family protein, partial [Verrucomicrobiota bacterium]
MNASLRLSSQQPVTADQDPLSSLWTRLATQIRNRVSPDSFERWFSGVSVLSITPEAVTLGVPNPIHQFFIESNYSSLLGSALEEVCGEPRTLLLDCTQEANHLDGASEGQAHATPAKESEAPAARTVVTSTRIAHPTAPTGMNPSYTFSSFIVGANNQFAHAASQAVANSPARTYNPLFIYGGSGLGKTHLLQSIGHHVLAGKKGAKVVYLRSEQFTNEFIDAIQNNALVAFRRRYRQADILMIDDIQFFAGKERSQEEFFH